MAKITFQHWVQGARPQTLILGMVPVLIGAVCVGISSPSAFNWLLTILCFLVAIFLQIGVNFANDYSDGIRGTDKKRVGPLRLVGSGLVKPKQVLAAAILFFGLASLAGVSIIALTQVWWLLAVGVFCLLAAWFYTGGKYPYGYMPLGELVVIIFFGLVPVLGTMYVQTGFVNDLTWWMGLAVGLFAAGVLMANNLRDREKDVKHKKMTLSVLVGGHTSRLIYSLCVLMPFAILVKLVPYYPAVIWVYFALPFIVIPAIRKIYAAKSGPEYVRVLQLTLLASLAFGMGITTVILLS